MRTESLMSSLMRSLMSSYPL